MNTGICVLDSFWCRQPIESQIVVVSVVDPDPHGSGTFAWIRIRN